jgi:sulfite reductase alpha subunit-like flavoprotein
VTLLDFASEWIDEKMQEKAIIPFFILEDSGIIP